MNPLTLEWIEKAEGDTITAERENALAAFRIMMLPVFMHSKLLKNI